MIAIMQTYAIQIQNKDGNGRKKVLRGELSENITNPMTTPYMGKESKHIRYM